MTVPRLAFLTILSPPHVRFSGSASDVKVAYGSTDGLSIGDPVIAVLVEGKVALVNRSAVGSSGGASLSDANPLALGTAAPGAGTNASRDDHVHPTTGLALSSHTHAGTYDPAGTAASGDAAHVAAGDPHPGYRTEAASPVDPAAGTAGLRTLGTAATQAAAGNDSRLSDSRTPTGTAGGDLTGTYPNPTIAAGVIVNADVNASAAIALSKLASIATGRLLGRVSASTGVVEELTVAQARTFLGPSGIPSSTTYLRGDGTWDTPAGGGGTAYGARGGRTTTQINIPTNTWTALVCTIEEYDDGFHDAVPLSRFTIPVGGDGRYLFGGVIRLLTPADGVRFLTQVYKNGVATGIVSETAQSGSGPSPGLYLAAPFNAVAGDYFELFGFHTNGSDRDFTSASFAFIERLGT